MENKQNQLGKNRSSGEEKVERIAEENVRERKSGVDAARGKKSKRLDLDHTLVGYELTA